MYVRMYVCMYVCMQICIIDQRFVAPCFLRSVYALKCSVYRRVHVCDFYNCIHSWTEHVVCYEDYRRSQPGTSMRRYVYKRLQPTDERVELFLPNNLPMRLCESETVHPGDQWVDCTAVCDVHIDKGATLNLLLQCLRVICEHIAV